MAAGGGLKKKEPNRGTCWGRNKMKEELPIACLLKIAHHLTTEVLVVDWADWVFFSSVFFLSIITNIQHCVNLRRVRAALLHLYIVVWLPQGRQWALVHGTHLSAPFLCWKQLIGFPSNLEVCNTVFLTIVTMLCIRSPGLTYLRPSTAAPRPLLPWPREAAIPLCFPKLGFSSSTGRWCPVLFVLLSEKAA